jgi:hypothetical protein
LVVIDAGYIYLSLFMLWIIATRIVNTNGGFKIVAWRLLGIRAFLRVVRQADGTAVRSAHRWKGFVKGTILQYYTPKGEPTYFIGGPKESVRVFGLPQYVYNYNDSRPLPLEHVETVMREVEVQVKSNDGSIRTEKQSRPVVVAGKPIDPLLIHAFATNRSIEQFNRFSDKPQSKVKWGFYGLIIGLIFILAIINVYYSYLFGINMNCAVHSRLCP